MRISRTSSTAAESSLPISSVIIRASESLFRLEQIGGGVHCFGALRSKVRAPMLMKGALRGPELFCRSRLELSGLNSAASFPSLD